MAHEINYNEITQQHSVFTIKPAWHGLGQIVETAQNSEEAIRLAGLDYEVVKKPIYTNVVNDGSSFQPDRMLEGKFATVRQDTGTPLGIVGSRYTVLQNREAFKFIDDLVGKKEAIFESAGALRNGEKVFLTCKLPQKLVVGNDDVADNYFFITNTHDGSKVLEMAWTSVYIVCNNTLNMALRGAKNKQRIKHTSNMLQGMFDAASIMGITRQRIQENEVVFNQMTKVNLSDSQIQKLIKMALYPQMEQITPEEYSTRFENILENAFEYVTSDNSQLIPERNHTLWGFVQGINGLAHHKNYKTQSDKVESLMFGTGYNQTNSAFDLAYQVLHNDNFLN